jgi:hypothetical protein
MGSYACFKLREGRADSGYKKKYVLLSLLLKGVIPSLLDNLIEHIVSLFHSICLI